MRIAAAVLLLTIALIPTLAVRLTLRRTRRAEWLDAVDRADLLRLNAVPPEPDGVPLLTTYATKPDQP